VNLIKDSVHKKGHVNAPADSEFLDVEPQCKTNPCEIRCCSICRSC